MSVRILHGDCRSVLATLPPESVHCVVTSPPYWGLRDYGVAGQIGLEETPQQFVAQMVQVFAEVRRVLRTDGTCWLNMGDSYANDGKWGGETGGKQFYLGETNRQRVGREKRITGLKPKDLCGIPWRVAFALQADGWWLRQDIIWAKPNPMPESVTDRCTKAHEYLFLLSKSAQYSYDAAAIAEPGSLSEPWAASSNAGGKAAHIRSDGNPKGLGKSARSRGHSRPHTGFNDRWDGLPREDQIGGKRNKRSVWQVATQPFSEAHFATFPPALIEPCILAGCPVGGSVLDPFGGAGTTGLVADRLGRDAILIELNPAYADMARKRISGDAGMFGDVTATAPPNDDHSFPRISPENNTP